MGGTCGVNVCGNAIIAVLDDVVLEVVDPSVLVKVGVCDVLALRSCVPEGKLEEETSVASEEFDGPVVVTLAKLVVAVEAELESSVEETVVVSDSVLRLLADRSGVDDGSSVCSVCETMAEVATLPEPLGFDDGTVSEITVLSGAGTLVAAPLIVGSILVSVAVVKRLRVDFHR